MLSGIRGAVQASCREMTASCRVACSPKQCPSLRLFKLKGHFLQWRRLPLSPLLPQVCPPSVSFTSRWWVFLFRQQHHWAAAQPSAVFLVRAQKQKPTSFVRSYQAAESEDPPLRGTQSAGLLKENEPKTSRKSNRTLPRRSDASATNGSLGTNMSAQKAVSESSSRTAVLSSRPRKAQSVAAVRKPIRGKALSATESPLGGALTNSVGKQGQVGDSLLDSRAGSRYLASKPATTGHDASNAEDVLVLEDLADQGLSAPWVADLPGWLKSVKSLVAEKRPQPMVIAFDIETTGFSRTTERIVEFAARDAEGGEAGEIHSLIYPGDGQSVGGSRHVHGISDEMLHPSLPMWGDFFPRLCAWVTSRNTASRPVLLVAHNGKRFDVPFVAWECARAGFELPPDWLFVDSLYIAEEHVENTSAKLQVLKDHFGIQSDAAAHRAPADVDVTLHVLSRILQRKRLGVGNLYDFVWAFGVKNEKKHVWGLSVEDASRFQAVLEEAKQKRLRQEETGSVNGFSRSKLNGVGASEHKVPNRTSERGGSRAVDDEVSLPSDSNSGGTPAPVSEPPSMGKSSSQAALPQEAKLQQAEVAEDKSSVEYKEETGPKEAGRINQTGGLSNTGPPLDDISGLETPSQSQNGAANALQLPLLAATRLPPLKRPLGRTAGEEKQAANGPSSKEPPLHASPSLPPLSRISRAQELGARIDQLRLTATKTPEATPQASRDGGLSGKEKDVRLFVRGPVAMLRQDTATPSEAQLESDATRAGSLAVSEARTIARESPSVVGQLSPPLESAPEQQAAASAPRKEGTGTQLPPQEAHSTISLGGAVKQGSSDAFVNPKAWSLQQRLEALKQRMSGQEQRP